MQISSAVLLRHTFQLVKIKLKTETVKREGTGLNQWERLKDCKSTCILQVREKIKCHNKKKKGLNAVEIQEKN